MKKIPDFTSPVFKKSSDLNVRISQIPAMDVAFQTMALSEYELLVATIHKLNELVTMTNSYSELIDEILKWVVGDGLEQAVLDKLTVWLNDGTLEILINDTLFKSKLDKSYFEDYKANLIQDLKLKLDKSDFEDYKTQIIEDLKLKLDIQTLLDYKVVNILPYYLETNSLHTALENAIAEHYNDGIYIIIPNGVYETSDALVIKRPRVKIKGLGGVKINHTGSGNIIDVNGSSTSEISGVWLYGNSQTKIGLNIHGIDETVDSIFNHIRIDYCQTGLVTGYGWGNRFEKLRILENKQSFNFKNSSNNNTFTSCSFVSSSVPSIMDHCEMLTFIGCEFANFRAYGQPLIKLYGTSAVFNGTYIEEIDSRIFMEFGSYEEAEPSNVHLAGTHISENTSEIKVVNNSTKAGNLVIQNTQRGKFFVSAVNGGLKNFVYNLPNTRQNTVIDFRGHKNVNFSAFANTTMSFNDEKDIIEVTTTDDWGGFKIPILNEQLYTLIIETDETIRVNYGQSDTFYIDGKYYLPFYSKSTNLNIWVEKDKTTKIYSLSLHKGNAGR